jgi:exportin-T
LIFLVVRYQLTFVAWVDLTVALTPESLSFFHRLLRGSVPSLRILSASILRTFIAKGVKEPADRLQVLRVLDILPMLDPLEAQTRDTSDDEVNTFRVALAGTLALYGAELIAFSENVSSAPCPHRHFALMNRPSTPSPCETRQRR